MNYINQLFSFKNTNKKILRKGFSLLEVIMSLIILGIIATGIFYIYVNFIETMGKNKTQEKIEYIANKIEKQINDATKISSIMFNKDICNAPEIGDISCSANNVILSNNKLEKLIGTTNLSIRNSFFNLDILQKEQVLNSIYVYTNDNKFNYDKYTDIRYKTLNVVYFGEIGKKMGNDVNNDTILYNYFFSNNGLKTKTELKNNYNAGISNYFQLSELDRIYPQIKNVVIDTKNIEIAFIRKVQENLDNIQDKTRAWLKNKTELNKLENVNTNETLNKNYFISCSTQAVCGSIPLENTLKKDFINKANCAQENIDNGFYLSSCDIATTDNQIIAIYNNNILTTLQTIVSNGMLFSNLNSKIAAFDGVLNPFGFYHYISNGNKNILVKFNGNDSKDTNKYSNQITDGINLPPYSIIVFTFIPDGTMIYNKIYSNML